MMRTFLLPPGDVLSGEQHRHNCPFSPIPHYPSEHLTAVLGSGLPVPLKPAPPLSSLGLPLSSICVFSASQVLGLSGPLLFPPGCRVPPTHPHPLCWEDKPKVSPARPGVLPMWPRATVHTTWGEFFHAGLIQGWERWHPPPHNAAPVLGGRQRAEQHTRGTRSSPTCGHLVLRQELGRGRLQDPGLPGGPGTEPRMGRWGPVSLSRKGEASRHDCI